MASKVTLNVFAANGTTVEVTKEYSRKIDAENAGRKSGNAWEVVNGKGGIVSEGAPSAKAAVLSAPVAAPKAPKAPAKRLPTFDALAAGLSGKAAAKKATPKAVVKDGVARTFDATGLDAYTCRTCGEEKPVGRFVTKNNTALRYTECRTCENTRRAAAKAAK